MMPHNEFKEILTSLFNGNAGQAEQTAETILYDNTYDLTEEWQRIRQDRINFELAILKKMCYND